MAYGRVWHLFLFLPTFVCVASQYSYYTESPRKNACFTGRGNVGSCVPLRMCPDLEVQFRNSNHHQRQYLIREYGCGFQQGIPHVCCPRMNYNSGWDPWGGWMQPNQWPLINTHPTPTTTPNHQPPQKPQKLQKPPTHQKPQKPQVVPLPEKTKLKTVHKNRRLLPEKTCGKLLGSKVLGGENAEIDEFPWMAMLQYQWSSGGTAFGCGGSLISTRYVLTAAHCIRGRDIPNNLKVARVRVGDFDKSTAKDCQGEKCAPPPQDIEVETIIVHKGYRPLEDAQYNDIALIRLKKRATLNNYVSPICIPLDDVGKTDYENKKLVVAGWGLTKNVRGASSDILQKVELPVISMSQCAPFYARNNIQLKKTQICAGGESNKDSCSGDSGGPLMSNDVVNSQPRWHVTGIVSFGPSDCGTDNVAGVYTKVAEYADWILDNMSN